MKQFVYLFPALLCVANALLDSMAITAVPEAPIFIRVLFKDGFESSGDKVRSNNCNGSWADLTHFVWQHCTDSDMTLIKEALKLDAINSYPKLAGSYSVTSTSFDVLRNGLHRSLTTNCEDLCCDYSYGYCYHDYPQCWPHPLPSDNCGGGGDDDFFRRRLTVIREEVVGFHNDDGDHTRTVTIAEGDDALLQMCEERKTQMIKTIWLEHGEVSADCGVFLDFSVTLQCILK